MTETTTHLLAVARTGPVEISMTARGEGHPVLLLHGGGGPATVTPWADQFATARHARIYTPIHPGFNGTPRPEGLSSVAGLAAVYTELLAHLDLRDVTVVGNSIGGWIAAEMAVLASDRVSSYVLVDAVGILVAEHPVADFFNLTPAEIAQRSYHNPETYGIDPTKLPDDLRKVLAANRQTLAVYSGQAMSDSTLATRLGGVRTPTLVVWGKADRIGDPEFGRAFAAAIPGATFVLLENAGHMPQIETPQALIDVVWDFADAHGTAKPEAQESR
jgi:pimeloyl-ACP methyl ester carboxylesterase